MEYEETDNFDIIFKSIILSLIWFYPDESL
jgi:hypothetical protein